MKTVLQIIITGGNSICCYKQWNTIIRSEKIDLVYMSVGNYNLFSQTNVMGYIYLFIYYSLFASNNLSKHIYEVAKFNNIWLVNKIQE